MDIWIMSRFFAVRNNVSNYIHKCVFVGMCCKWFQVAPKCFSKENVLFYAVVNSTHLRLTYKYPLTYSMSDVIVGRVRDCHYGIQDKETNSSFPFWEKLETFGHVKSFFFDKVLFM